MKKLCLLFIIVLMLFACSMPIEKTISRESKESSAILEQKDLTRIINSNGEGIHEYEILNLLGMLNQILRQL